MEYSNQVILSGEIIKAYPIRYTPIGIPVVSFVLRHQSLQQEAGISRKVNCKVYCVMGEAQGIAQAKKLEKRQAQITGFLAQDAKAQTVLHVKQLIFLDKGI
jgi:primosomal replication protein N